MGIAIVIGTGLGFVHPPHGRHAADPLVRAPRLGVAALSIHALLLATGGSGLLLAAGLVALAAFVARNRHLLGFGVLLVGLAMNAAVVVANGGMPVRAEALVRAEVATAEELVTTDVGVGRHLERTDDVLVVLADIIPVRALRTVVSFGDLVAAMGIAVATTDLVRYSRRPATDLDAVRRRRRRLDAAERARAAIDEPLGTGHPVIGPARRPAQLAHRPAEPDVVVLAESPDESSGTNDLEPDPHPGLEPLADWLAPDRDGQLVGSGSRRS